MKEVAKLDGTPVYQTVTMGAAGTGADGTQAAAPPAQQQQAERPSLTSALGGRFGLGRKKPQDSQPAQQQQQAPPGTLLEMTTEYTAFSSAAVDPTLFEVPSGFKKVEPDAKRMQ
jgi:hypothetical protein